ncbi:MAG: hypothetical protein MRJ92_00795 [Nitrospira sp.]|nr:hypothetical protein [Nitrospira sp.]
MTRAEDQERANIVFHKTLSAGTPDLASPTEPKEERVTQHGWNQSLYQEKADVELPSNRYTVTFIFPDKSEKKVEVVPDKIPYGPTGLPE